MGNTDVQGEGAPPFTQTLPFDISDSEIQTLETKIVLKTHFLMQCLVWLQSPCRALLWKVAILHDLSFPGWRPTFLTLSGNAFHRYVLGSYMNSCLLLDSFMSKIHLKRARVYLKIIALMAMPKLPTDVFHKSSLWKPGAWGGTTAGRHNEKKRIRFLPPESMRIFSHSQVAIKGISFM